MYIDGKMKVDKTIIRLSLTKESDLIKNEKTSELLTDEALTLHEFMELVEALAGSLKEFSKHELEGYILEWSADIRASREN